MHPFNFVRNDFIIIETNNGKKKVSRRKYKISNNYCGVFTNYVGRNVRLINLDNNRDIGEHFDDILAVTLDDHINLNGGMSYTRAIGVEMRYLEPITR